MKIALLGNFRVDYTSESDYKWTLEKMGHEVFPLQETEATGQQVYNTAIQCDALYWIHTHGWRTPGLRMRVVLDKLRKAGIPSFSYHLDVWFGLPRQRDVFTDEYFQVDHFFTVDKAMADFMNSQSKYRLAKGHYLPPAVIERDCFFAKPESQYSHDIIFTGSYDYHKEWMYRRQLLDWLHENYKDQFHRFGRPFNDQPDAKYIMGAELNKVYASCKIVVGDTFCPNFEKTDYWSNRTPETLGKGGFLIHPFVSGMENYFQDRKHLVFYEYGNFEQLAAIINYYLQHPEEREAIKEAGQELVKSEHTFTKRFEQMFNEMGLA